MKSLIGFLLLTWAFSLPAVVNAPMSNAFDNLGAVKRQDKKFIVVKNNSGGALVAGQVLTWDLTSDDGANATTSSTRGAMGVACVLTKACASGAVCHFCQIYGKIDSILYDADFAQTNDPSGTATAGEGLYISGNVAGSVDAVVSPGVLEFPFGVFLDSPSASGNTEAFLNIN